MTEYYYLVAGLPDVTLDDGGVPLSLRDFVEDMKEHVTAEDAALLGTICLPIDNANLIALMEQSERPFIEGGNYSQSDLTAQLARPDSVPDYMETFIEARKDGKVFFEGLTPADELNWLFYEEMSEHPNGFIRDWFNFDRDLRNVLAGINSRRALPHIVERGGDSARALNSLILGRNDTAELILRSGAPDFGLSATLPWTEKLFAAAGGGLQDFEKTVDTLRCEMLEHLTILAGFGVESILAAALRIGMAERWGTLDPEKGKEKVRNAVAQLKSGFRIPADFARAR